MRIFLLLTALFFFRGLQGQELPALDLFKGTEVCTARIQFDFDELEESTREEEYISATLEWIRSAGDTMTIPLEVRARGNMRKDYCEVPPLRVKFPKEEYSFHKLKWVHNCRKVESFKDYILLEYLVYRMYQVFTDESFRVQLFDVTFMDTGEEKDEYNGYAFLIESEEQLGERLGLQQHENKLVNESKLDPKQVGLITFFQYMIANTDWAILNKHNLGVYENDDRTEYRIIPYDFDYSGFVNTPYSQPQEGIPIKHVKERYNKAYCLDDDIAAELGGMFVAKEREILSLLSGFPGIDEKQRKKLLNYMESFFKQISKPKAVKQIFCRDCTLRSTK